MARLSAEELMLELQQALQGLFQVRKFARPRGGWLRLYRRSYKLSGGEVARRMGVSRHLPLQFERAEDGDRITLRSLRAMAAAMDLDLVYGLIPKVKPPVGE